MADEDSLPNLWTIKINSICRLAILLRKLLVCNNEIQCEDVNAFRKETNAESSFQKYLPNVKLDIVAIEIIQIGINK